MSLAIGAARLGGGVSRRLKIGGGTSLPGLLASRIDPNILGKLAGRLSESVVITGTNGKTTTANMLAEILKVNGLKPVHNDAGANLASGLVTAIIAQTGGNGSSRSVGLFEIDEATIPKVVGALKPKVVAVTNIFRDQLDRYGELDHTAGLIKKSLSFLDKGAKVALNADDPRVATLADGLEVKPVYFGLEDQTTATSDTDQAKDSNECLLCDTSLDYELHYFAHLGKYRCPSCGFTRPEPEVKGKNIRLTLAGTRLEVETPAGKFDLALKLSGLYNVYNALAAVTAALALGIDLPTIKTALERFTPSFGRMEEVKVADKSVRLMLIKNPTGFNQVIRTLNLDDSPKNLVIAINDNIADGADVSWLWDVDIERLGEFNFVITSGIRAEDMAVRLKYAGFDPGKIIVENKLDKAVAGSLGRVVQGGSLYILPTYTAMLEIRRHLRKISDLKAFWDRRAEN